MTGTGGIPTITRGTTITVGVGTAPIITDIIIIIGDITTITTTIRADRTGTGRGPEGPTTGLIWQAAPTVIRVIVQGSMLRPTVLPGLHTVRGCPLRRIATA